VLLERRARVVAVDPAELAPEIAKLRGVTHVKASAFDYAPDEPVDWLVCDMAWRPLEVAALVAKWGRKRWARAVVLNVKLPMKRKVEMLERVREAIAEGGWQDLRMRHLYHDRDENHADRLAALTRDRGRQFASGRIVSHLAGRLALAWEDETIYEHPRDDEPSEEHRAAALHPRPHGRGGVAAHAADESVSLVVTDPPYESLEKHRAIGTTTRLKHSKASSNDWFTVFPNARFAELYTELYRVLARDSHLYVFSDAETMFVAKPIAERVGFKFWKPIVWDKRKIGMGYHYRSRYEFVLFFEKGKRKLNDLGVPDILEVSRIFKATPRRSRRGERGPRAAEHRAR